MVSASIAAIKTKTVEPERRRRGRVRSEATVSSRAPLFACLASAFAMALLALAGCGGSGGGEGSSATTGMATGGAKPNPAAEPQAGASSAPVQTKKLERSGGGKEPGAGGKPASGVCPRSRAKVVSFQLLSDVPGPRCQVVGPNQRLQLINLTGGPGAEPVPVTLDWAGFHQKIKPHQAVVLDGAVGTYLKPGVHDVVTKGAPGPTVWLKP
jgi:hypothetical protein